MFSTEDDLVIAFLISSTIIVSLRSSNSSLLLIFISPSLLSFHLSFDTVFQRAVPTQYVTNKATISSFFNVCRIFFSYLALCHSSFSARSMTVLYILPDCFVYRGSISQLSLFLWWDYPANVVVWSYFRLLSTSQYSSRWSHPILYLVFPLNNELRAQ
jgi:hypothetical protein